jgi:accessory gene regulator protein AgrB
MDLCKYKNMFGKPGEGAHSFRIFNIAIIDVLLTILLAFVISFLTGYNFMYVLLFIIATHIIFLYTERVF